MNLRNLRKEPVLLALVLFCFCLTAGAFVGRIYLITSKDVGEKAVIYQMRSIVQIKPDYFSILKKCIFRDAMTIASLLFFSTSLLGNYYFIFRIGKRGFLMGLLLGQLVGTFGGNGIWLGLAYFFPAWCLYFPAFVVYYQIAFNLWSRFFHTSASDSVFRSFLEYRKKLLIWGLVFLLAAVMESTLGNFILRAAVRAIL